MSAVAEAMSAPKWQDCALITIRRASQITSLSPSSLYKYEAEGRLTFRRLGGRTLVTKESLAALIENAENWKPSNVGAAGRNVRAQRARAAWQA